MQLKKLLEKANLLKLKDLAIFILVILVFSILGLLWRNLFSYKIFGYEVFFPVVNFLGRLLLVISDFLLNHIFSIHSYIDPKTSLWVLPGNRSLELLRGCTGLKEMILFVFIIIFSRGSWKKKLVFIPSGLVILQFVNVIRVVSFGLSLALYPGTFHFIHHYLFNLVFFAVLFFLWILWIERFSQIKREKI